jgi:magnesium chelatase subunit D
MVQMRGPTDQDLRRWSDACLVAQLIAIDPPGLGGVWVKSQAGPVRDSWLKGLEKLLLGQVSLTKIPVQTDEGALLGELDLLRTLAEQKRVYVLGILAEVRQGLLLMPMAERLKPHTAALITQAFDREQQFGMIAFDESLVGEDHDLLERIGERLGLQINLECLSYRHCEFVPPVLDIAQLRQRYQAMEVPLQVIEAIMLAAQSFGIGSLRAGLYTVRAARAIAALRGSEFLEQVDVQTATRLVFAHRLTRLPQSQEEAVEQNSEQNPDDRDLQNQAQQKNMQDGSDAQPQHQQPEQRDSDSHVDDTHFNQQALQEMMIEAVKASLSQQLLNSLALSPKEVRAKTSSQGKAGQRQKGFQSGQAMPSRQGKPSYEHKIDILKTIQAASPWQKIRRSEMTGLQSQRTGMIVRSEDIFLKRYEQRSGTVTVFVVDASGSAAMERLAEAKGAVELMLAQCYVRRDQVALLTFRGKEVAYTLPPTRSLVRAKRLLADMLGGGGTPLAVALQELAQFGRKLLLKGQTPLFILLTDGRANVSLEGIGGREQAFQDAMTCAKKAKQEQLQILFIDTGMRPQESNQQLAKELGAQYIPLPQGKSVAVVQAAKSFMAA